MSLESELTRLIDETQVAYIDYREACIEHGPEWEGLPPLVARVEETEIAIANILKFSEADLLRVKREFELLHALAKGVVAEWDVLDTVDSDDTRPTQYFRDCLDRKIDLLRAYL